MAISVDWPNKIINVPQADLSLVSPGAYELDVDVFRLALKDLEDGEGMPFPDTHQHNTTVTIGGVTLARVVEIINGYTVTFEDGQYAVNLVGANNNISDVANVNQVSIRSGNTAGLVQVSSGSGLSTEQDTRLKEIHQIHGLESGSNLTITDSARTAASISQTVSDDGTTTTVSRS
jgi:hypothetical protein